MLQHWAHRLIIWEQGKQVPNAATIASQKLGVGKQKGVFVFFDNDVKAKAPQDAKRLRELVS